MPDNVDILRETVGLRDEYARLLDFSNYAVSSIEGGFSMAPSADAVLEFLDDLQEKLYPIGQREYREVNNFLKQDNASAEQAYRWDGSYYRRKGQCTDGRHFTCYHSSIRTSMLHKDLLTPVSGFQ